MVGSRMTYAEDEPDWDAGPYPDDDLFEPAIVEEATPNLADRFPLIDWHELWADEHPEEWILEPILPARRLIAIYSPPKHGKSLLMLELAVAISRGTDALGVKATKKRVLYVDFENDPRGDIRERLQSMGFKPDDLDNLCYLSFPSMAKLDTLAGAQDLMAVVAKYACEVVVIDTVGRAVAGEENDNDTWLNFYRHTGLAMKRAGVSSIRLDHSGKDLDKGMRGASAKYGDVDAVWRLTKVTDTVIRLDCTDHRMPVAEKTLVLERRAVPHLHHQVQAEGRIAAWRHQVEEIITALDELGAEPGMGRDGARALLRTTAIKAGNSLLSEAIKERKQRNRIYELDFEEGS